MPEEGPSPEPVPLRTMSWPSNVVNGGILLQHDWLVDEWPWDPLTLATAPFSLAPLAGARNNNGAAPALPTGALSAAALPAEAPGGGSGSGGHATLKRRSGSRPQASSPDARGPKQAKVTALVCRVPGCGVALDSRSNYCKRTR